MGLASRSAVNLNRISIQRLSPRQVVAARCYQTGHAAKSIVPKLAFCFDIDGVLLRGAQVLPAAKRALAMLEGQNPMGIKIPYILLTNGGGISEEERRHKLTAQLGVNLQSNQLVQAHTILKSLVHKYADRPVLVLGGKHDAIRKVAHGYGFKKAYTTLDVHAWNPTVWPFHELTESERRSTIPVDFSKTPISAVFVFHDPRNWSLDIQVICDVIQSNGIIGGPYEAAEADQQPREGNADIRKHRPVELVFCNPDLLWRSEFERPRLGQGAFRVAFEAVYKALTGSVYPYVQYGKPTTATYKFAEKVLRDRCEELHGENLEHMPRVYMVGDNPESDIAGANAAGWSSVLVRTGVYDPQRGPPTHRPTHEADDVEAAVRWAIEREFSGKQDL